MAHEAMSQDAFRSERDSHNPPVLFENIRNSMIHLEGDTRGEPLCGLQRVPLQRQRLADRTGLFECAACAAVALGDLKAPVDECPHCDFSLEDVPSQAEKPGNVLLEHIHEHQRQAVALGKP